MASSAIVNPVTEVVEFFAHGPSREDIAAFHLSPAAHGYLRDLLARNAAGVLSADEERVLDQMVLLDDILSLLRARVHGIATTK